MSHLQLDPGETQIAQVRRHPWLFFIESAFLILLIVLPPLFYILFVGIGGPVNSIVGNTFYLFAFVYSFILLFVLIIFSVMFTNFYLDVLIITSERLIDVEQIRFFSREVATTALENIQDITVKVDGIIASFFGFGDLYIQTAAERREFILKGVPEPDHVKQLIYDLSQKEINEPHSVKIVP